jgi:hypothetical protein
MGRKKKTPQAAGQYLGYSLQQTLFLSLLLQSKRGYAVSLEVFEDVGVEKPSGQRLAAQAKSVIEGNPISDRAVGLWKTFSNWVDAAKAGTLKPEATVYQIYVSKAKGGEIVNSFEGAKTKEDAQIAIVAAKAKLWGSSPTFPLKNAVADTIRDYVKNVFENESIVADIVASFSLKFGTGSSHEELKSLLESVFVPGEVLEQVVAYALGWIKIQTDAQLANKLPAVMIHDDFHAEITSYIRKAYRHQLLLSFAPAPKQHDIAAHLKALHIYVLQLELIEADDEDKLRAISDFLWAATDRTEWSSMGLVNKTSFSDFEEDLKRTWKNLDNQGRLLHAGLDAVARGGLLFSECAKYKGKLEGLEVPSHFTPGSFHALADVPVIGWHPDYKEKLKSIQPKPKGTEE